jgi:hypothetical protein
MGCTYKLLAASFFIAIFMQPKRMGKIAPRRRFSSACPQPFTLLYFGR